MSPDILHTNKFPSECVPTVFDSDAVTVMIAGEPCTLGLFDTPGQEGYGRLWPLSYPQTDVSLVCFPVVSPSSSENVKDESVPEITRTVQRLLSCLLGPKLTSELTCELLRNLPRKNRNLSLQRLLKSWPVT